MDYRIISFAPPPESVAEICSAYEACWTGASFSLKGATTQNDRHEAPLQALIRAAEKRELAAFEEGRQEWRGKLLGDFPIKKYLFAIYDGRSDNFANDASYGDRNGQYIFRDIRNEVNKVRRKRTIFLVPDYWPECIASQKFEVVEKVLQFIASEMNSLLVAPVPHYSVGFMRLRRSSAVKSDTYSDHPGMMNSIIKRLLFLTSKDLSVGISAENGFASGERVPEGPILFDGPTGTGKSLAAELLALSMGKEIVHVNVAGLTESILEGQMRGYKKGSFTGAINNEDGWFAKAHGKVLFLDEFQNASLASQTQLLDLLDPFSDDIYVNPIGESGRRRYSTKVILAVNKPVQNLLAEGLLREDLFYRIRKVIRFRSLSDHMKSRRDMADLERMIHRLVMLYRWKSSPFWPNSNESRTLDTSFLQSLFPELDKGALNLIAAAPWNGNFRELERVITDLHWKNECRGAASIGADEVQAELDNAVFWTGVEPDFRANLSQKIKEDGSAAITGLYRSLLAGSDMSLISDPVSWDLAYLSIIESLFLKNDFNIEKTVSDLRPMKIKISSRPSLRNFLRNYYGNLSSEVRGHEKIRNFVGEYEVTHEPALS